MLDDFIVGNPKQVIQSNRLIVILTTTDHQHKVSFAKDSLNFTIMRKLSLLCHIGKSFSQARHPICDMWIMLNILGRTDEFGHFITLAVHQNCLYKVSDQTFIGQDLITVNNFRRAIGLRMPTWIRLLFNTLGIIPVLSNFAILKTENIKYDRVIRNNIGLNNHVIPILQYPNSVTFTVFSRRRRKLF